MDPVPVRIVIELDSGARPIAGRVSASRQPAVPFTGWTSLFAVLRVAAGEDDRASDTRGGE